MVLASRTPNTADCISLLGMVILSNGVTRALAAISCETYSPDFNCHLMYAEVHIATVDPSLNTIKGGGGGPGAKFYFFLFYTML